MTLGIPRSPNPMPSSHSRRSTRSPALHRAVRLALVTLMALQLGACGWQLRGHFPGADDGATLNLQTLQVINRSNSRLLMEAFEEVARDYDVTLEEGSGATLSLINENIERRPLAYGSTGVAVQYQLVLKTSYAFSDPSQNIQAYSRTITSRRNYDFDAELIVAKKEEELSLLSEMRREASRRILSNLRTLSVEETNAAAAP